MKLKKMFIIGIISCLSLFYLNAQIENNLHPPEGTRFSDGLNPFPAPVNTTNYYGSGDINLDGVVDLDDLFAMNDILNNLSPGNPQSDINYDGSVDQDDMNYLDEYINYSNPLPGWWDRLSTEGERIFWINKILALDDTHELTWANPWFVCKEFADQQVSNFSGRRIDYIDHVEARFNWGPTRYNIPMYRVGVEAYEGSHAITAVLVGDNPEDFTDWYFIEPQYNTEAIPGDWDFKPGEVEILGQDYDNPYTLVKFNLGQDLKATHIISDTGLVTSRPSPSPTATPDNRKDYWNPYILNEGNGKVIFDTSREDMARWKDMDIHESDLPFSAAGEITLISDSSIMGHILDVFQDQYGTTHLLYIDKPKYLIGNKMLNVLGIYYGIYDAAQSKIINAEPLLEEKNLVVDKAKIAMDSLGNIHVFWHFLLDPHNGSVLPEKGIYWTYKKESVWQTPERLIDDNNLSYLTNDPNWEVRNFNRGLFSTVSLSGNIHLAWVDRVNKYKIIGAVPINYDAYNVMYSVYSNGNWSTPELVTSVNDGSGDALDDVSGLTMGSDNAGNIHLVYQRGGKPDSDTTLAAFDEARATLEHKVCLYGAWSESTVIDNTSTNLLPQMDIAPVSGKLYLVWEKKINDQVKAAWSKYVDNSWSTPQILPIRQNANAWYPTVKVLDSEKVYVAFSSRCPDQVTIETCEIDKTPITLYYETQNTSAATPMIHPSLKIKNEENTSINLEDITIRYWYTHDEGAAFQSGMCLSAGLGGNDITSFVNLDFEPVIPALSGADSYLEISFDGSAGSLDAGQETGAINLCFWKSDLSNYTQTNDYSFDASMTTFAENTKLTGYIDSVLEYGDIPE